MHYVRADGRYYIAELTRDLWGPVVVVAHGGSTPPQIRSLPVDSLVEGERLLEAIHRRRVAHGYAVERER